MNEATGGFIDLLEQDKDLLNEFAGQVKRETGIDFFIKGKKPSFEFGNASIGKKTKGKKRRAFL